MKPPGVTTGRIDSTGVFPSVANHKNVSGDGGDRNRMKQILAFILMSGMLCWIMFAPIYKHVLIARQALLQKEVDYMLEVGANASHGYIDQAAIEASKQRLAQHGFSADDLEYTVATTNGVNGMDPSNPVMRGAGLYLRISYPYEGLFAIDRLIGIGPPSGSRMAADGMKMSEYVP